VVGFGVVLADPAAGEGARFVFHGAPGMRGDAVSRLGLLGKGGRS